MTSNPNLSHTLPHLYYPHHEPLQLACPTSTNTTHSINTLAPLDASFTVSNHLHSTHLSPTRRKHIEPIAQLLPSSLPLSPNRNTRSQQSLSLRTPQPALLAVPTQVHCHLAFITRHALNPLPDTGYAHLLWISTHSQSSHSHSQPSHSLLITTRRHAAISQPSHSHLIAIS